MAVVQTDQSLQWIDYEPIAAKIPQDIFYQSTTADVSNNSSLSFYVITPASNALLDNEAYIQYSVTITSVAGGDVFRGMFEGNAATGSDNDIRMAMRQCWPLMRSYQSLSTNINGTVISNQPYIWCDAMHRMYLSEEEAASVCSMSGGEFDKGYRIPRGSDQNFYEGTTALQLNANVLAGNAYLNIQVNPSFFPDVAGLQFPGNNNAAQNYNITAQYPPGDKYLNEGFATRFYRLARISRENQDPAFARGFQKYNTSITFDVFERIPICPFLLYDSRDYHMSIPHVRTLTIAAQFSSNAANMILQGNTDYGTNSLYTATNNDITIDWYTTKPKLRLKWIMSKDIIPPNITIPAHIIREYGQSFNSTLVPNTSGEGAITGSTTYSNINLEGIPDLMLVYLRYTPTNETYRSPSERYLSITSLLVTVAGTTGKMNAISNGELYMLWLKNVVHRGIFKQSFDDWYKKGCVVALRPKDYGCLFGPGMDYPVQISIQANYANYNMAPSVLNANAFVLDNTNAAISYMFYVVCVYQRYSLSLNSGGGSRLSLLKVPLVNDAVVGQAPMQVNP